MTPKGKIITTVVVSAVAVTALVIVARKIKLKLDKLKQGFVQNRELNKEIKSKGNFPPSQYRDWANGIQDAFDPYGIDGWGTDEEAIYNIIKRLKNNDDWLLLKQEYGVRPYKDYSTDVIRGTTENVNLTQAILKEDENSEMKNRINNILAVNKITYRV
jgi:hypothetical protein